MLTLSSSPGFAVIAEAKIYSGDGEFPESVYRDPPEKGVLQGRIVGRNY